VLLVTVLAAASQEPMQLRKERNWLLQDASVTLIVRCRMVKLIFTSAFFFLSACSVTTPAQRVAAHGYSSRFEPGSRTNSFDCDAEIGRYSELNSAISGTNAWITGFMQVLTLRTGSAWPPDAGVVFAGTSKLPRVGLETFVLADKPAILQIAVRGAGGAADHTVFASVPISDSQIRFTARPHGSPVGTVPESIAAAKRGADCK
jgi:hypothetical protein